MDYLRQLMVFRMAVPQLRNRGMVEKKRRSQVRQGRKILQEQEAVYGVAPYLLCFEFDHPVDFFRLVRADVVQHGEEADVADGLVVHAAARPQHLVDMAGHPAAVVDEPGVDQVQGVVDNVDDVSRGNHSDPFTAQSASSHRNSSASIHSLPRPNPAVVARRDSYSPVRAAYVATVSPQTPCMTSAMRS